VHVFNQACALAHAQTLEDEFGGPAGGAQQEQEVQGYLSHRRSSVSQRFLLDPNDLSDLLRSSSRKIQKLAVSVDMDAGIFGPSMNARIFLNRGGYCTLLVA